MNLQHSITTDSASEATGWGPLWLPDGAVRFRIWAPDAPDMKLLTGHADLPMAKGPGGWFHLDVTGLKPGDSYCFRLPDGRTVADPASRLQAGDVHGPSLLVRDDLYHWQNNDFRGRPWEETIISEIHVGTFTPEGTYRAAIERLPALKEAGITAVELMPLAQFAGERGWGYDGVLHYAPHRVYGSPEDLKALVDAAHGLGLMIFLDVVYNHFGPEGNYLSSYASSFFRPDEPTPWGASIDFRNPAVREFFIGNALMWVRDYRFDGLRFDAAEQIRDDSDEHFLQEVTRRLREATPGRYLHLAAEDHQCRRSLLVRDDHNQPRYFTACWTDSLHHSLHVAVTQEAVGHYKAFADTLDDNIRTAMVDGFLFPDSPEDAAIPVPPDVFVNYIQNHDQIGNRAFGDRLTTMIDPDMMDTLMASVLLIPQAPLLFMGDEYGEQRPFRFFADIHGEVGEAIRNGRIGEAENFGGMPEGKTLADLPDALSEDTFQASKLDWQRAESEEGRRHRERIRHLIELRLKHVTPLLRKGAPVRSKVHETAEGLVAIDWAFPDGTLSLRMNLTNSEQPLPEVEGAIIHTAGAAAGQVTDRTILSMPGPGLAVAIHTWG